MQYPDRYVTLTYSTTNNVLKLNDGLIDTHLKGGLTYGIFSGGYFNKFITFDVDCKHETTARWATLKLVHVLVDEFGISRKHIHVSLSGNKGYHVDLFFDKPILVSELKEFYRNVISNVGAIPNGEIEFRATWKQGVKLPLGVHQKTGQRCWFVDNETLEPIKSFDYILTIEQMSSTSITKTDFGLTEEQIAEFETVASKTDISVNAVDLSGALQRAAKIIETGRLTQSGTRHKTTFTLACFGNTQGWEQAETVNVIMDVLTNTPREYFSEGSTPDYWQKEAERLTKYVFEKDITIKESDRNLVIYKSEILAVLGAGTFRQKQLAYAMLITSKRYGNIFYLTMRSAMKMIGTNSHETVQNAVKKLIETGFIKYHRKSEVDRARSLELGEVRYKPNKYRLTIDEPKESEDSVKVTAESDLIEVALMLCSTPEIRKYVKRHEFNNRWKARVH